MRQTSEVGFSADWLALREPADLAARDAGLLARAAATVPGGTVVLDLGSGTGSTARAFDAQGFTGLRWRFVDNDPALMAVARRQYPQAERVLANLGDVDNLPLEGVGLVTASALLDLMPQTWVDALALRLAQARIPFYAALSYDGVMHWTPAMAQDDAVTTHFNIHQCTDKGIGAALGPTSGVQTAQSLRKQGFDVTLTQSPWIIGPDQAPLHRELLEGIGAAAAEAGLAHAPAWSAARIAAVETSTATIGHSDLLALPA